MAEIEGGDDQFDDIELATDSSTRTGEKPVWGKRLCALNWRIDVPVPTSDTTDDEQTPDPHAVVEAVFSQVGLDGKEMFETVFFRISHEKLVEIVESFSKAAQFGKNRA